MALFVGGPLAGANIPVPPGQKSVRVHSTARLMWRDDSLREYVIADFLYAERTHSPHTSQGVKKMRVFDLYEQFFPSPPEEVK